ncbi:MAG: DUF473 domain-containing protein [Candidatus Methanoperedens sp.]|nr:DUF473 domain-containing protein [Candidatus Methanoperedens sp.]CAG0992150.1 hypothetical protein METP1_02355 [Methanosarcinales archaeon]
MRHILLSGISHHVLSDLEHEKIKTIEIRSPHNFLSVLQTNVGDVILLTATSREDVRPGTMGLIVRIREKQVSMHRVIQKTPEYYEESEFQLARLQLEMRGHGRVRRCESNELGEATLVDADEVRSFEGR